MMRIAKSEARKYFSDVVTRAGRAGERVKITHYGKTLAILISPRELASLDECEKQRRTDGGRQINGTAPRRRQATTAKRRAR